MQPYLLSILSGLLLTVSFPTTDLHLLAWVALLPFFFAIEGRGWKDTFRIGYAGGIAFYWSLFYWLTNVTAAGFLVLTLYLALYFPLFGLGMNYLRSRRIGAAWIAAPFLWTSLEYIRTYAFTGLPWGLVGVSQHGSVRLIQISSITGVYGVSFVVILVNAVIYECARNRGRRCCLPLFFAAAVLCACLSYGSSRLAARGGLSGGIRVGIVQGNVPQEEKFGEGFAREIMDRFFSLTLEVSRSEPDLIVWPETSVPGYFAYDTFLRDSVGELERRVGTPILFGSTHVIGPGKPRYFNSAFLVDSSGEIAGRYDKIHLVLFGEIIPCKGIIPFLKTLVPYEEDFTPGRELTVFPFEKGNFSALICFEDIMPDLARGFVRKGARLLVNITNDAWFGRTSQPYQHVAHAVFRCVENNVCMVRATNTGVSCFIDRLGRIEGVLRDGSGREIFTEGTAVGDVSITRAATFYTRWGNLFAIACTVVTALLFGIIASVRRH